MKLGTKLQRVGATQPIRTRYRRATLGAAALLALLLLQPGLAFAQAGGIKAQDPATADKGQGNTGWVQAPTPRGHNQPEQTAQGNNAAPVSNSGHGLPPTNQQPSASDNPGTAISRPVPNPSGLTTAAPQK
jgi:hypothetical protein